jgi:hypothetical protein
MHVQENDSDTRALLFQKPERTGYPCAPHEATWCSGGIVPPTLTSALDVGEWSASLSGRFTPVESVPVTHYAEGCVDYRVSMEALEKKLTL